MARHHDDLVVGWKLHHLAGGEELARGLLPRHHQVTEPRREPMAGIVALGAEFGRGAAG